MRRIVRRGPSAGSGDARARPRLGCAAMNTRTATRAAPLDLDLIRAQVAELAAIDRPTATPGELTAAQWVAEALGEIGIEARLEREDSNGGGLGPPRPP